MLQAANLWSLKPNKSSLRSCQLFQRRTNLVLSRLLLLRVLMYRSNNKIKKKKYKQKLKVSNIWCQMLRKFKSMISFQSMMKKSLIRLKKLRLKSMLSLKSQINRKKRKFKLRLSTNLKLLNVLFLVRHLFSKILNLLNALFLTKFRNKLNCNTRNKTLSLLQKCPKNIPR